MKIILSFKWHLAETKFLLYVEVSNINARIEGKKIKKLEI